MPIEDRKMTAGTVLVARYRKQDRTCEVVETAEGLRYRLDDGTEHKSPSSAGKAAMGGVACNGWRFWSTEADAAAKTQAKLAFRAPPVTVPVKKAAKTKAAPKTSTKAKSAKKPKGKATRAKATDVPSYGCGACGATFGSQKAAVAHAMTHTS